MTTISYSFSTTVPAQPDTEAELLCLTNVQRYPGPAGTVVLLNPSTDAKMVVTADVSAALMQCSVFRTLAQHAERIASTSQDGAMTPADVIPVLEQVRSAGLFETEQAVLERLNNPENTCISTPLPGVRLIVLTCDRPQALARLLESINQALLGEADAVKDRIEGIWVIDDSTCDAAQVANIEQCKSGPHRVDIHYIGPDEQGALLGELMTEKPELAASAGFLLDRKRWADTPSYGLARNWALLVSAGKHALVFDDDVLCEAVLPPVSGGKWRVGTHEQYEAAFYRNREALDQHKLTHSSSPLGLMLAHLGRSMAALCASEGKPALSGTSGAGLHPMSGSSKVRLVQTGFWGDPGTGASNWALFLQKASLERLLASDKDVGSVLAARSGWAGYRQLTVTRYGSMSGLTGIDHSQLLPPYIPVGRGEDILFAIILLRLYPSDPVVNLPYSVPHIPIDNRASRAQLQAPRAKLGLSNLADWLGREPPDQWGRGPEQLLETVAAQIDNLCDMPDAAIDPLLRSEMISKTTHLLGRSGQHKDWLQTLNHLPGADAWGQFIATCQQTLAGQLQASTPLSFAYDDVSLNRENLRNAGREFASALRAWPALRSAASELLQRRSSG